MHDLDLSTLTLALSGAEPIDPDAVEAFVAAAEPFGFPSGGVFPAFGMAEVAIGGSFPPRDRGLVCDTVDRVVLERDRVAKPIDVVDPDDLRSSPAGCPCSARRCQGSSSVSSTPTRSRTDRSATSASCSSAAHL